MQAARFIAVLLSLGLMASSCGSDSENTGDTTVPTEASVGTEPEGGGAEPVDEPAEEGEDAAVELEESLGILCTLQEEWCEAQTAAFADMTGVDAQYQRLCTGEAIARLEAEGDDPSFDVWFGGPSLGPATAVLGGFIEPEAVQHPRRHGRPDHPEPDRPQGCWYGHAAHLAALHDVPVAKTLEDLQQLAE